MRLLLQLERAMHRSPEGPGSGSGFSGSKPASEGPNPTKEQMKARILVADNDRSVLDLIRRIVGKTGNEAICAKDGKEALELFKQGGIDLIISDREMPRMGGLELLHEVRKLDPEARAIIVSGGMKSDEADEFYRAGAALVMQKPFGTIMLMKAIETNLGER
jgi:DNA-binding NtrC family response regulator